MSDGALSFLNMTGGFIKRNYGKGTYAIKNMQNLKAAFFDHLPTSDEKPSGEGFFIPVNVEGNESGRASNEQEAFDNAQSVKDVQFQINPKTTFWPFELTGLAMDVAISSADSYARSLKRQMNDNLARFMSDLNRQAWGQATGVLTQVNGAGQINVNTIIVDSVQYFRTGMYIDSYAALGGALEIDNRRITSIDKVNSTITIAGAAVTVTNNGVICKHGVLDNAPADYKELFGANAIVDTTTFNNSIQGQSKVTYPVLQATVVDSLGANVTNAMLQQCETGVENASEMEVSETWSARVQRDKYLELLTPLKRFMNDDAMDSGKRKPVEHNGNPWYVDKDCQESQIYKFTKNCIEKFILTPPDIVDKDGSVIRALPGSDKYQGYYKTHMNLGSLAPNSTGKIINLPTT